MKSWQEAAKTRDARCQVLYGLCFYYGHGVEEAPDEEEAVKWFRLSADHGNDDVKFAPSGGRLTNDMARQFLLDSLLDGTVPELGKFAAIEDAAAEMRYSESMKRQCFKGV